MCLIRTAVATTLVGLLMGFEAAGQVAPPRQQRSGAGRIRGRVLSAESGTPIRRAQVMLAGEFASRSGLTDAAGRFEFTDLPAGRFMLRANKNGYMLVQYGQVRPFEAGKALELAERQAIDGADLMMTRGLAIVGRIVDDTGGPLTDALVTVHRQQWINGRRRWLLAGRPGQTNDLGEYRVYGLAPGAYQVTATLRNMSMPTSGAASAPGGAEASPAVGYAPTYYPGTASAAEAHKVTVAAGRDTHGVDFTLVSAPLARISGVVVNAEGRPAGGTTITLIQGGGTEPGGPLDGSRTGRDGSFSLSNVPPGDYTLQVRSPVAPMAPGGDAAAPRVAPSEADFEFAVLPLMVSGEDVSAGVIKTTRGATVTGRVVFEGPPPPNLNALRIAATDDSGGMPLAMISGTAAAPLRPDGTFEMKGLIGVRLFRVLGAPVGWSMTSIRLGGSEVIDSGVEFAGADTVNGLEIVLSSKSTDVAGTVLSAAGKPLADYTVVLFAEDPANWRFSSGRWVRGLRPAQDGRFQLRSLPAGAYYAVAVDYIPQGEWTDPDLLERLRVRAQRFSLAEGESKTLELKLTEGVW